LRSGNAHGVYKGEPNLRFDRLKEIDERVEIPLVLHGGSGIEENDFKECIKLGIRKINVATSTFNNVINHINKNVQSSCYTDYFVFHQDVIRAAYENVKYHIEIFGSSNRIEKLMQKI